MRSAFLSLGATLLSIVLAGCPSSKSEPPSSTSATAPPSAATPPATISATASASAIPTPAEPSLVNLLAQKPTEGTRRSETVTAAGGVYAGLPPDWSTGDVYNQYLIASTKKAQAMVYLVIGSGIDDKSLERFANDAAYPIYLKGLTWDDPWLDAKIGPQSYEARVRRGHGVSIFSKKKRRAAIVVGVKVPDRKTIHILGSWDEPAPEIEAQFLDLVRGLGRCKHKPNRGCVAVEPLGEEKELENAPKKAPGSSPFG